MVGLLVSSPMFAEASKHHNAFRLIGLGLAVRPNAHASPSVNAWEPEANAVNVEGLPAQPSARTCQRLLSHHVAARQR